MITSKSKRIEDDNGLLNEGIYLVKIVSSKVEKRKSKSYNDITTSLKVLFLFEKEKKHITRWYPLVGYKRNNSGDYLLRGDKRIADTNKTLIARSLIMKLFTDVCIDPDCIEFDLLTGFENIENKLVGISVTSNDEGKTFVNYTIPGDCREATDERHIRLRLIENIFEKMFAAGEIIKEDRNWHGNLFDRLYDMNPDELNNFEKKYGLKTISKKHDNDD